LPYPKPGYTIQKLPENQSINNSKERGFSILEVDGRGNIEKRKTFSDESENPPAINDPSWDIDEQLKLRWYAKMN